MPRSCSRSLVVVFVCSPLYLLWSPLIQAVYIFAGSILLADNIFVRIIGSIVGLIGVAYVVLEFIPSIEPPQNMREADGGWGAEQV